jgi:5-methylcytosine-specific restriction endonuclease McrA
MAEEKYQYWKGKKFSEKHCKNLSKALKGRKLSKKHIENLKKAENSGRFKKEHKPLYFPKNEKNPNWIDGRSQKKEYINWRSRIERARKKRAKGSFTIDEWELLKKQYGYTCPSCGKSEPEIKLTIDHIIPLIRGGSNYIENIQPLCEKCNCKKYIKIIKF